MQHHFVIIDKTDRSVQITVFIQRHVFIIHLGKAIILHWHNYYCSLIDSTPPPPLPLHTHTQKIGFINELKDLWMGSMITKDQGPVVQN